VFGISYIQGQSGWQAIGSGRVTYLASPSGESGDRGGTVV